MKPFHHNGMLFVKLVVKLNTMFFLHIKEFNLNLNRIMRYLYRIQSGQSETICQKYINILMTNIKHQLEKQQVTHQFN